MKNTITIEAVIKVRGISYKISAEDVETAVDIAEGLTTLDQPCPYCGSTPQMWFVPGDDGNIVKLQCLCGAAKKLIHKKNGGLVAPNSVSLSSGRDYSTNGWEFYNHQTQQVELHPLPEIAKPSPPASPPPSPSTNPPRGNAYNKF